MHVCMNACDCPWIYACTCARALTLPRPAPLQWGDTPLHYATKNGQAGTAEVLIKAGADLNAKDKNGHTATYHAAYRDRMRLVQLLQQHGATDDGQIASATLGTIIAVGVRWRER